MTRQFSRWAARQDIPEAGLRVTLEELRAGQYEANLGGHLYKKRIRFKGQGKSGSGWTIIFYKKGDRAIFVHGFAKNEKGNLSSKELVAFKEFVKILLALTEQELETAIINGNFIEVQP
jgi:hypothetical protein